MLKTDTYILKKTLFILLLVISINSFTQITLKQHNFVSIGDTIIEHYKRFPKTIIDVGEPGENVVWDFSNLSATNKDTIQFVDPKKTPFAKDFPKANIALYTNNIYKVWMFMNNSDTKLTTIGSGVFVNNKKRIDNRNVTTIKYPLNYLDESLNKKEEEKIIIKTQKGNDSIKRNRISKHTTTVDSWGDIILPTGTFLSLRLKHVVSVTDYFYVKKNDSWRLLGNSKPSSSTLYQWWTDDKKTKHPVAQIVMDEAHKKPIIIKFLPAIPFSEVINENTNGKFKIYPNPATDKIFLNLNKEEIYVTIYTLQGKIIKNMKTNSLKPEIDVTSFSAGVFFIITRNKAGQVIRKAKFIKQ